MTILVARCPLCGDVEMDASAAITDPETRTWAFECGSCGSVNVKQGDDSIMAILEKIPAVRPLSSIVDDLLAEVTS